MRLVWVALLLSVVAPTASANNCTTDCDSLLALGLANCAVAEQIDEIECENMAIQNFQCEQVWLECELRNLQNGTQEDCSLLCTYLDVDACYRDAAANRAHCDGAANLAHATCLELCRTDCDGNGLLDAAEVAQDPGLDCNGNGFLDSCEITGLTNFAEVPVASDAFGISSDGQRVYVSSEASNVVTAFDVSEASQPVVVGTGTLANTYPASSLVVDDYLYVGTNGGELVVLDLSNVAPPPSSATLATVGSLVPQVEPYGIGHIARRGNTLFLSGGSYYVMGFLVVDITDRVNPTLIGWFEEPLVSVAAVISGDYAFLATDFGFGVVDVGSPASPLLVHDSYSQENGTGIASLGTDHVVVTYRTMIEVVDITTPLAPSTVASVTQLGDIRGVHVDGMIAYVLTATGVFAYDLSEPTSPALLDQDDALSGAYAAAVAQDRLVVAGGTAGIAVYNTMALDQDSNSVPDVCEVSTVPPSRLQSSFALDFATPNPFNPATRISWNLPAASDAKLEIFDSRGRHVVTLVDGREEKGPGSVRWNGRDSGGTRVSSGLYFYRLRAGKFEDTKRMLLLK